MAEDWNKPDLNSTKALFPGQCRGLATSAVKLDPSADSNIPTGAKYYDESNRTLKRWNGSTYDIVSVPTIWGGTSGGSANAQTLTLAPAITAYVDGMSIRFRAGFTNTNAATLNVNGIGAVDIQRADDSAIKTNDIVADEYYEVVYSSVGTKFILGPKVVAFSNWTPTYTPDVGALGSTTTSIAEAKIQDDHVFINLVFNTTPNTAPPTVIDVSLPWTVRSTGINQSKPIFALNGSAIENVVGHYLNNAATLRLDTYDAVGFSTGTVYTFHVWNYYQRKAT